jgi:hypothetical protein
MAFDKVFAGAPTSNITAPGTALSPMFGLDVTNKQLYVSSGQGWQLLDNGAGPTINFADNETPTPPVDGITTVFTLAHTPNPSSSASGSLEGVHLNPGAGNDYTISGNNITMTVAPPAGVPFLWSYRY